MAIEERRKKLMMAGPQWGDRPTQRHVAHPMQACIGPREDFHTELLSASNDADAVMTDMGKVIEPLPPPSRCAISTSNWTLDTLVKSGPKFRHVPRVHAASPNLSARINDFEQNGEPIIIEGWHEDQRWPKEFHIDWLSANGPGDISVRNVHEWTDKTIQLSSFVEISRKTSIFASMEEQERLYAKDIECPKAWNEWLHESNLIPESLLPDRPTNLLLNHPQSSSVETLMCYIGIGDTFTPCHKDLCASSGQNLMCYTENGGSSFWFMTKSSDAPHVSAYFHKLNQELDHETHVITVEQLAQAPFDVYIAEQKLGDLVLVPPRSCHQVVNYGGITVKTSWSRMTLKGLVTAYYHELPIYRRVCRPEIYRVKSTIYYTLLRQTIELESASTSTRRNAKVQQTHLSSNLRILLQLFDDILTNEYSPNHASMHCLSPPLSASATPPPPSNASSATLTPEEKEGGYVPVLCDFCGADVFQSFFECRQCVDPQVLESGRKISLGDGYVICAGCYAEGRSCKCVVMDEMQCRSFRELLQHRNRAAEVLYIQTGDSSLKKELKFSSSIGTFRAACALKRMHKLGETKVCTSPQGKESTHSVPYLWALSCKKCHSAKCFWHLLVTNKVHSIDAILNHTSDKTHHKYHDYHLKSRVTYNEGQQCLRLSQEQGSQPNLTQQRVHISMTYETCKPVNAMFMCPGWYDIYVQIHNAPSGTHDMYQEREQTSMDALRDSLPSLPSPSTLSSPASMHLAGNLNTPAVESSILPTNAIDGDIQRPEKRKRMILDFVDVPPSSYRTKPRSVLPSKNHPDPAILQNERLSSYMPGCSPTVDAITRALPMSKATRSRTLPFPQHKTGKKSRFGPPLPKDIIMTASEPAPATVLSHLLSGDEEFSPSTDIISTSTPVPSYSSLDLISPERERASKCTYPKSKNITTLPRFKKTRTASSSQEVQLAQAYNSAAVHNHRMTEDIELSATSHNNVQTAVGPGTDSVPMSPDPTTAYLVNHIHSLEKQVSELQQQSQQQQSFPPLATIADGIAQCLIQTFVNQIPNFSQLQGWTQPQTHVPRKEFRYNQKTPKYYPHYSKRFSPNTGYNSTPLDFPGNKQKNQIPRQQYHTLHKSERKPWLWRNNSSYPHAQPPTGPSAHRYDTHYSQYPYNGRWPTPDSNPVKNHYLSKPTLAESSSPNPKPRPIHRFRNEPSHAVVKCDTFNGRPLQRMRYDRQKGETGGGQESPAERYQTCNDQQLQLDDATGYPDTDIGTRNNDPGTPRMENSQPVQQPRELDSPRLHDSQFMEVDEDVSSMHEPEIHQSRIASGSAVELSSDWEEGYEQDDEITSGEIIFKNSSMDINDTPESPEQNTVSMAFIDPTINPWQ